MWRDEDKIFWPRRLLSNVTFGTESDHYMLIAYLLHLIFCPIHLEFRCMQLNSTNEWWTQTTTTSTTHYILCIGPLEQNKNKPFSIQKVYYLVKYVHMHYVWFSQFWSHWRRTNALFASEAKINVFWNSWYPSGTLHSKFFQKTLILAFEANNAFVLRQWDQNCENQT